MLDGEGCPRYIWRTTEITIKPLSFAWDEGEGDRTRDWWLDAHRRYFGRQASREQFEFDDHMLAGVRALGGRVAARYRRYDHGSGRKLNRHRRATILSIVAMRFPLNVPFVLPSARSAG